MANVFGLHCSRTAETARPVYARKLTHPTKMLFLKNHPFNRRCTMNVMISIISRISSSTIANIASTTSSGTISSTTSSTSGTSIVSILTDLILEITSERERMKDVGLILLLQLLLLLSLVLLLVPLLAHVVL